MIDVIEFEDGKYGLRNSWTGIILTNFKTGRPLRFRSIRRAQKRAVRLTRNFNRTIKSINKRNKESYS